MSFDDELGLTYTQELALLYGLFALLITKIFVAGTVLLERQTKEPFKTLRWSKKLLRLLLLALSILFTGYLFHDLMLLMDYYTSMSIPFIPSLYVLIAAERMAILGVAMGIFWTRFDWRRVLYVFVTLNTINVLIYLEQGLI
ncbi:MAG: hypothetical protein AAGH76_08905 [Pseudomonadota bacterium]